MKDFRVNFPAPCDQPWEGMKPLGSNRHCESCATTVVDIELLTVDEVETLLRVPGKVCARARLDRDGRVETKGDRSGVRFVATIGAGLGLIASSAALADNKSPSGAITGSVAEQSYVSHVEAKGDGGFVFMAKVNRRGKFTLKRLPPGRYQLKFISSCGEPWEGESVSVEAGKTSYTMTTEPESDCIVVGMIERADDNG